LTTRSIQQFGLPVSAATMYLVVRDGVDAGRCFTLDRSLVHVGRSSDRAELVLKNDSRISRRHATLIRLLHPRGAHFVVLDEGSKNGVLVNGARVQVHCLTPCDVLQLGNTTLDFLPAEMLPAESDHVSLMPLEVDASLDRNDLRKPGEVY